MVPWESALPLQRTWCLYELASAAIHKTNVELIVTPEDKEPLQISLSENAGMLLLGLEQQIDIMKSDTRDPSDKTAIIHYMKDVHDVDMMASCGCVGMVWDAVMQWVVMFMMNSIVQYKHIV